MNIEDYPMGADDSSAPWNEKTMHPVNVDVVVTITLSKMVTIRTNRYTRTHIGNDEDGSPEYDYEFNELASDVLENVSLPNDFAKVLEEEGIALSGRAARVAADCKGWELEDIYADEV